MSVIDLDRVVPVTPRQPRASWGDADLSLLGTGRRPAPPFPAALLGPYWRAWAERKAEAASAPVDYVATALLACAGATLANVRWPLAGAEWSEPPLLWCAAVGSPSSGKSPALDAALDLVRHVEERLADGFDEERQAYETEKQVAEARREEWKLAVKAAVKGADDVPALPPGAEVPDAPVRPRIRVADATVEALAALAAALPRGLLLVRDELSGWLGAFDRYGGGGSDRAFAIEMYGGRPYVIDRVKSPEPLRIRHLSVGVLGGVQPDKLDLILSGPDDGLAARLLWSWPDALPRFTLARSLDGDGSAKAAFDRLSRLSPGSDEHGNPEPKRLKLTPDAENRLEAFAREVALRAHEASGPMAGALGKARGHALRLSAVLEHLRWCAAAGAREPTVITEEAMVAALGLVDGYFLTMAERVFGDASIPVPERHAMTLARYLRRQRLGRFNARELRRSVGGSLREPAEMDRACLALIEAGLIREDTGARAWTGRKAKSFEVHPALAGGQS